MLQEIVDVLGDIMISIEGDKDVDHGQLHDATGSQVNRYPIL